MTELMASDGARAVLVKYCEEAPQRAGLEADVRALHQLDDERLELLVVDLAVS